MPETPADQPNISRVWMGADDALGDDDAVGVADRISSGEISAAEAVDAAIERAERAEPLIAAFATTDFDQAPAGERAGHRAIRRPAHRYEGPDSSGRAPSRSRFASARWCRAVRLIVADHQSVRIGGDDQPWHHHPAGVRIDVVFGLSSRTTDSQSVES